MFTLSNNEADVTPLNSFIFDLAIANPIPFTKWWDRGAIHPVSENQPRMGLKLSEDCNERSNDRMCSY